MISEIYLKLLPTLALCFCLIQFVHPYYKERVEGKLYWRLSMGAAILFILPLVYFAWQRGSIGDTHAYLSGFNSLPSGIHGIVEYLQEHPKDPAFYATMWFFKELGFDFWGFCLVLAFFQAFCLAFVYRKYSSDYFLSILLFVLSTDYVSWMLNGIRQYTAVSICFLAAPLIFDKKFIRAAIIILIASQFHKTAIMALPIMLIVQGKPFNIRTMIIMLGVIVAMNFVSSFTDFMDSSLQDTQYKNVVSDYTTGDMQGDDGTNPLRVLVYSVPALIALVGKKRMDAMDIGFINVCTNMSIMSSGLYLISMVTSGIFLGRLPIYCSLYSYILLPWEIRYLFTERSQKLVYLLCLMAYGFFCYISVF